MTPTVNSTGSDSQRNGANGQKYGDMRDYMGPSLFQPHRARQAIRDAHEKKIPPLIGYYAGFASIPITRWLAPMGFDYVWIDWEHSAMNIETMTTVRLQHPEKNKTDLRMQMVHEAAFLSNGRTIPFVR
jgi:4-hydroxy-2-oxoheptanedioate aldolase